MVRFFILFIVILVSLFTVELTHPVQNAIVLPWTGLLAKVSAAVLVFFDRDVISYGKVLQHSITGVGVSSEAGCNGIETCLIFTTAVLVYPASWQMRMTSVGLGFVALQAVNVLRIIVLFYLAGQSEAVFRFAHLYF